MVALIPNVYTKSCCHTARGITMRKRKKIRRKHGWSKLAWERSKE